MKITNHYFGICIGGEHGLTLQESASVGPNKQYRNIINLATTGGGKHLSPKDIKYFCGALEEFLVRYVETDKQLRERKEDLPMLVTTEQEDALTAFLAEQIIKEA